MNAHETALVMRELLGHDAVRESWTSHEACLTDPDRGVRPGIRSYRVDLRLTAPRVWVLDDDRGKRERVHPAVDRAFGIAAGVRTLTVRTPSGGEHRYMLALAGATPRHRTGGGLDVLVNTNVMGPGSVRDDGGTYEVTCGDPIVPAPGTLLDAVTLASRALSPPRPPSPPGRRRRGLDPDALCWAEGSRNDSLWRYGRSLRGRGVPSHDVAAAMTRANEARCTPPVTPEELHRIHRSVMR